MKLVKLTSQVFMVITILVVLAWFLREVGIWHFERPENLMTPALASAIVTFVLDQWVKKTEEEGGD